MAIKRRKCEIEIFEKKNDFSLAIINELGLHENFNAN